MCGVPRAAWTFEQRWIAALLVLLILFDNPLIALDIFKYAHALLHLLGCSLCWVVVVVVYGSPSLVWTGISTVLAVSFMAAMLMFWLCVVDVVRSASAPVRLPPPSNTLCSLGSRVVSSTSTHTHARAYPQGGQSFRGVWFYLPKVLHDAVAPTMPHLLCLLTKPTRM